MANKPLVLNPNRQYPLVAEQAIDFTNVADADVPVKVMSLPRDATILSGSLTVTAAFGGGFKLGTETDDDMYGTLAGTAGTAVLTPTNEPSDETALFVTPAAASTAGAGVLRVTYVLANRGNEVQP